MLYLHMGQFSFTKRTPDVAVTALHICLVSLSPTDFCILYIHCFVYTVYDDFSGQQSSPGTEGQNTAHYHTNNTATETDSGGFP